MTSRLLSRSSTHMAVHHASIGYREKLGSVAREELWLEERELGEGLLLCGIRIYSLFAESFTYQTATVSSVCS